MHCKIVSSHFPVFKTLKFVRARMDFRYAGDWTVQSSLASHTLHRERKGLVTLQLLSCRRGTQLPNIAVR